MGYIFLCGSKHVGCKTQNYNVLFSWKFIGFIHALEDRNNRLAQFSYLFNRVRRDLSSGKSLDPIETGDRRH